MRFFSNDKDARDDQQGVDVQDRVEEVNPEQAHDDRDLPDHVQSDPVPVPQQRTGSPWSSTPSDTAAEDDTRYEPVGEDRRDDAVDAAAGGPDDRDRPPFHEPSSQPTAFGASTVGGAVAASATANPENDRWDATDRESDAASGVADDRSVAPGDGVITDDLPRAGAAAVPSDEGGYHRADDGTRDDRVDVALDDRGSFNDPQVMDAESAREDTTPPDHAVADTSPEATADGATTEHRLDGTMAATGSRDTLAGDRDDAMLKDAGGFDDPRAVEPSTDRPLDDSVTDDSATRTADVDSTAPMAAGAAALGGAAAAGVAAGESDESDGHRKPGAVSAREVGNLFGDQRQSFQDRWREVQLRFVDGPQEATTEAAGLLDEVLETLTANLRAQKDALSGAGSDDTEKLRVQLRGYRDMINRILDL